MADEPRVNAGPWRDARLLVRARLTAARNRLTTAGGPRLLGALLVWWAGILVLGHFAAPGLLAPPEAVLVAVTGAREGLPRGAAALEASFWLTMLAASLTSFRVMELLFRRADIRSVEYYPISLGALFLDRLLAACLEALLMALLIAPFFAPLVLHGGLVVAAISSGLLLLGLVSTNVVGLAVQLAAGASIVGDPADSADARSTDARPSRSVYGGSGQVFIYSPGIALAVSVVLILLAKLSLGEALRAGPGSRALWFGMSLLAVATLTAAVVAWRRFRDGFHRMAARFREADFINYEVAADYQRSDYGRLRPIERALSPLARPLYRVVRLQYSRRYMLTRYGYGFFWLAGGLLVFQASVEALPEWIARIAGAMALAVFFNPWARLAGSRIHPNYERFLPVGLRERRAADRAVALVEVLLVVGPYALVLGAAQALGAGTVAALGAALGAAGSAVAAGLGLHSAIGLVASRRSEDASISSVALTCALSLLGIGVASYQGVAWLMVLVCVVIVADLLSAVWARRRDS